MTSKETKNSRVSKAAIEPREATLSQVECDTTKHREVDARLREETSASIADSKDALRTADEVLGKSAKDREVKLLKDDLEASNADQRTQAEKFADAAREHGVDESEDAFKGVLRKLGKSKS